MLSSSGGPVRLYFPVTLSQPYFVHTQRLCSEDDEITEWRRSQNIHPIIMGGMILHTEESTYVPELQWFRLSLFDLMNLHKQHALGINHSLKLEF